jgi:Fic family protein
MDVKRFSTSPIGDLVAIQVVDGERRWNHFAYQPAPLPTDVVLGSPTWAMVSGAAAAVARLDGAARRLPNPYLLVRPALVREAVSTSALEGTYAALEDVLQAEFLPSEDVSESTAEVRNYVVAAEHSLELIKTLPICLRLIREAHERLMAGARGDHAEIGNFRKRQNWIGRRRRDPVTDALFVPPPHTYLREGLNAWERWVNADINLPTIVKASLAHYQFETLHPFIDGNGRVGRLVVVLQLITAGDLTIPLLNLSPYLERYRDEYIDHLRAVSETGDFEPWIDFFSTAVKAQAEAALIKADKLIDYRDELRNRLHRERVKGVALRIADDLVGAPVITPTRAGQQYGVTFQAANSGVARLVELGVLREITGRSYARMFVDPMVIDLINE